MARIIAKLVSALLGCLVLFGCNKPASPYRDPIHKEFAAEATDTASAKGVSSAPPPSWRPVTISTDKVSALAVYDASIQREGPNVRAWVSSVLMKEGRKDENYYREFNCEERSFHTLQVTTFPKDEDSITDTTVTDWRFAVPGSMNAHILNYVCFGQLP